MIALHVIHIFTFFDRADRSVTDSCSVVCRLSARAAAGPEFCCQFQRSRTPPYFFPDDLFSVEIVDFLCLSIRYDTLSRRVSASHPEMYSKIKATSFVDLTSEQFVDFNQLAESLASLAPCKRARPAQPRFQNIRDLAVGTRHAWRRMGDRPIYSLLLPAIVLTFTARRRFSYGSGNSASPLAPPPFQD